jgi:hypothetical protein
MSSLNEEGQSFSFGDEDDLYDPVEFDPETTSVDDELHAEIDSDTLAFRDAVRDIWASEGQFAMLLP